MINRDKCSLKIHSQWGWTFLLLLMTFYSWAQIGAVDSLIAKLEHTNEPLERGALLISLTRQHLGMDLEKVKLYLDQAAAIPVFANDPYQAVQIKVLYGRLEERNSRFDKAKKIFAEVLESQKGGIIDTALIAETYYKLGDIARREGSQDEAIGYLQSSRDLYQAIDRRSGVAQVDIVFGVIYKKAGLYDKALKYYGDAYETYKALGSYDNMATCILNSANVYSQQNKFTEAIATYQEALGLAEKVDHSDNLLAFIYGNMSNCYAQQKNPKLALSYQLKGYELRKDKAGPEQVATDLIGIANGYSKLGEISKAKEAITQAIKLTENVDGLLETNERIYLTLYHLNVKQNNLKDADKAIKQYLTLHDSTLKEELHKQALDLNAKYETEKKEDEIDLLSAKNELSQTSLLASRKQNLGLALGLLIVGGLLLAVAMLFRKTKNQNQLISKSLAEKDILLREIHHRVKNNLQFISSLLGLQSEHISDETALSALQEGQDRVQSMALIHQNLYQEDNLTGVGVKGYFVKLIRNLFDSYNIRKDQVKLTLDVEDLNLDVDTVIPLGLIVNELVSNSLKYAFSGQEGQIDVSLKEDQGHLQLTVKDDGQGMSDEVREKLGSSFGYRLIQVFKEQMQADLEVTSDQGTQVVMRLARYRKAFTP